MNSNELKKILKPLVKQLVKEAMQEELSTVISEIMKQTSGIQINERKQSQQTFVNKEIQNERLVEKEKFQAERKKMLEEISKKSYGGINIFEGTTPVPSQSNTTPESQASNPLSGVDPNDPGVDITSLVRMTGGWKQIK
jgi:hypothetical protein